jgi:hypothetical protein
MGWGVNKQTHSNTAHFMLCGADVLAVSECGQSEDVYWAFRDAETNDPKCVACEAAVLSRCEGEL